MMPLLNFYESFFATIKCEEKDVTLVLNDTAFAINQTANDKNQTEQHPYYTEQYNTKSSITCTISSTSIL